MPSAVTYREAMRQAEREYFAALMVACNWNHSIAAETAQLNRTAMYRMLERVGLSRQRAPITRKRKRKEPKPKRHRIAKLDRARVHDLKAAGVKQRDISRWLGVTREYVGQVLRSAAC